MKNFSIYKITAITASLLSVVFCIMIINIFKISYAITPDPNNQSYPNNDFVIGTINTSGSLRNSLLIGLSNNSGYDSFMSNFTTPVNLYTNDEHLPVYLLEKNLITPGSTETFEVDNNSYISSQNNISDKGISYIINHGFNTVNTTNTIFTKYSYGDVSDNDIKYYVTQIALWLYIFENKDNYSTTYCSESSNGYSMCDFLDYSVVPSAPLNDSNTLRTMIDKASKTNGFSYLKYIIKLVDEAKNYVKCEKEESEIGTIYSNFTYKVINENKELFVQNIIPSITGNKDNYLYYDVSLEDPNSYGAYISDSKGNKIGNSSQMTSAFSIVIPISNNIVDMDLSTIKVNVVAYFLEDKTKIYNVTKSINGENPNDQSNIIIKNEIQNKEYKKYSDVTLGYSDITSVNTSFKLNNIVEISNIDQNSSKELPGASIIIKNDTDNKTTYELISSETPHYISLEPGNYSLCEKIAPEGYELVDQCVQFKVTGNNISKVQLKSSLINSNLSKNSINYLLYLVIFVFISFGIILFLAFKYKKKEVN